jgi:hypothetical protein
MAVAFDCHNARDDRGAGARRVEVVRLKGSLSAGDTPLGISFRIGIAFKGDGAKVCRGRSSSFRDASMLIAIPVVLPLLTGLTALAVDGLEIDQTPLERFDCFIAPHAVTSCTSKTRRVPCTW